MRASLSAARSGSSCASSSSGTMSAIRSGGAPRERAASTAATAARASPSAFLAVITCDGLGDRVFSQTSSGASGEMVMPAR